MTKQKEEQIEVKGYVISDIGDEVGAVPPIFRIEGNFYFENEEHKHIFESDLLDTFTLMLCEPHIQTLSEFEEECETIINENESE